MWQAIATGIGAVADKIFGDRSAKKAYEQQKEFAQSGIQWRVEDAKKAGIHPLYALGAQTHSFSPTTVGTDFASAGANIGGAMDAARTRTQKVDAVGKTMQDLALRRAQLENDLLESQLAASSLALTRQAGRQTAMPSPVDRYLVDGQGSAPAGAPTVPGLVVDNPMQRVRSDPERPSMEPGAIPDIGYSRTATGWQPVRSQDIADRMDDDLIGALEWSIRNRILPRVSKIWHQPPNVRLKDGYVWKFDPVKGEYYQSPGGWLD